MQLRPLSDGDLDWAADLANAACAEYPGFIETTPADLARRLRSHPGAEAAGQGAEVADSWIAVQSDKRLGWAALVYDPRLLAAGRAHLLGPFALPGEREPQRLLVETAVAAARALPVGEIHTWFGDGDVERRDLVTAAGFAPVRSFCFLGIDLLADIDDVAPPPGLRIDDFAGESDLAALVEVKNRSFAEHWGTVPVTAASMRDLLERMGGRSIVLLARSGTEVVGFCWARLPDQEPGTRPVRGWIENLGVVPEQRNRHLGRALLLAGFRQLRAAGAGWAGLTVDAANAPALQLYRNAGMSILGTETVYVCPLLREMRL